MSCTIHQNGDEIIFSNIDSLEEAATTATPENVAQWNGRNLSFDFQLLKSVNSVAIKSWAEFVAKISGAASIVYLHCPDEFVVQFSMIPQLATGVDVKSVIRNYECLDCGHVQERVLRKGVDFSKDNIPEDTTEKCPKCQSDFDPTSPGEDFFEFMNREP